MKLTKMKIKIGLLLGAMALLHGSLMAQSIVTGALAGRITDPTGSVVADAVVTTESIATGESQATKTNNTGNFIFSFLKPGAYVLVFDHPGFSPTRDRINVLLGQTVTDNITLTLGSTSGAVVVESTAIPLQEEDGNITNDVNLKAIQNLPIPGNDLSYLAQISPGATMNTSSAGGQGSFSVFGLPATSNLFTINGNDYNDPFVNLYNSGSSNLLLGANEVGEVAIVSNGYTGQYGRQAGAQIDFSTLSGANAFHGDAIYYWNGSALNAKDFFLSGSPKPFENNNQWAARLGGPIKKNKAFFFVNTEGIRYIFGTTNHVVVPDPALEAYVLANLAATSPAAIPFYQKIFGLYNAAPGISGATPVTPSNMTCGALSGTAPFSNGQPCLDEFFNSGSNGNREWFVSGRIDYNFDENNKLFGRVKIDRGVQPTYTDAISPLFDVSSSQPQTEGQINYTHVFGPRAINNLVASVLHTSAIFQNPNHAAALAAFPYIYVSQDTSLTPLGEAANIYQGFPPPIAPYPQGRVLTQWQLVDDFSIERGNHTFKIGVNFRRDGLLDYSAAEGSFPVVQSNLADFSSNIVDQISQNYALHPQQPISYYSLGFYFQDEYRVNSRLKLTLALRADHNSSGTCSSDCVARTSAPFAQLNHDPSIPYNQMMTTGISQILPGVEDLTLQPRVGFAWSPWGNNTVIRGGIGLFSDLYPGSVLDYFTTNFPQVTAFTLFSGAMSPSDPGSAASLINTCNTAFQSNYNAGGTASTFLSAAPAGCTTPNLHDVTNPLKTPKYLEWNLEIQHSFGQKTTVSINYVGNHGFDEFSINPYLNSYGFGALPTSAPDSRVQNVLEFNSTGESNYNGVTLSVREQLWHGFQAGLSYTYSHSLDDISNGGLEQFNYINSLQFQINPFNPRANYGSSDYDVRHYVSLNYVWDLPFKGHGTLDTFLGGWTVSGTLFRRTGFPYSIVDGLTQGTLGNAGTNLPDVTILAQPAPGNHISSNCGRAAITTPCFSATDFTPATDFNSGGRNAYRGPGYFNTDFSVRKAIRLRENLSFVIGATAFNVLNHPNFANPNANLASSANLGLITGTVSSPTSPYGSGAQASTDARIVQVFGKIVF